MPRLTRESAANILRMYDLWMFDIAALRWTDITANAIANGPVPGFRQRMGLVPFNGSLYLFSGFGQEELLHNVSIDGEPIGEPPPPRPILPQLPPFALPPCTGHEL
jgi:hypothetical protein